MGQPLEDHGLPMEQALRDALRSCGAKIVYDDIEMRGQPVDDSVFKYLSGWLYGEARRLLVPKEGT